MSAPSTPDFDASGRLYAPRYDDIYRGGGTPESDWEEIEVFLGGNDLRARFSTLPPGSTFTIGETGFGTGLSFLRAAAIFLELAPPSCRLHFVSVEAHPLARALLARCHAPHAALAPLADALRARWPTEQSKIEPVAPLLRIPLESGRVVLFVLLGQAETLLAEHPFAADAWFLDGFAPARNPAMWSRETLNAVAASTRPAGTFATWTVATAVLDRLRALGFAVEKRPGVGRKRQMSAGHLAGASHPGTTDWWWRRQPTTVDGSSRPRRVAIHGDGLAACSTAAAFAARGVEVDLVVPVGVRRAASDLPVGVLQPRLWNGRVPDAELVARAFAWTHAWLTGVPERAAAARFEQCGALHAVLEWTVETRMRGCVEHTRQFLPVEWLTAEAAGAKLGSAIACHGAAWIPQAGCMSPESLSAALVDMDPRIRRVRESANDVDARIIAAGAGSGEVLPGLSIDVVGGQLTRAGCRDAVVLESIVSTNGHVTPVWHDGYHYAGSTYRPPDEDGGVQPTRADDEDNAARAERVAPGFGDAVEAPGWVGTRAVTKDHLPYAGAVPDRARFERVFAAFLVGGRPPLASDVEAVWDDEVPTFAQTAHASRGMATAPFCGELLAAELCGEVLPLGEDFVRRLAPSRAFVRGLRKGRSRRGSRR